MQDTYHKGPFLRSIFHQYVSCYKMKHIDVRKNEIKLMDIIILYVDLIMCSFNLKSVLWNLQTD